MKPGIASCRRLYPTRTCALISPGGHTRIRSSSNQVPGSSSNINSIRNDSSNTGSRKQMHTSSTASMKASSHDGTLSSPRAQNAIQLLPTYLTDARSVEKFSPQSPNGALQLSVAENQMLQDLLLPALNEFSKGTSFPADAIYYQPTHGREQCRRVMASYIQDILGLTGSLDEDGIVIGAGCNAVLENLCISLASPGEGVMIPTPYYAAFQFDLGSRAGLSIVPVRTMSFNDEPENKVDHIPESAYYPNKKSLDAAYKNASDSGTTPRILLISHPMNPLGICYPPSVIQDCIDWCRDNKVHLISDEIYAGSVHNENSNFVSTLELASAKETTEQKGLGIGPFVHLVYALSKDFALSGLRVGALYSENEEIRLPLQKLNDLCCVSSQTQLLVEKMLTADKDDVSKSWYRQFLKTSHERLAARSGEWQNCLDELAIPHFKATAGMFVWMDFREFLLEDGTDDARERTLYLELLMEYGLLFTPGSSMKNELPGFFRCVYTAASDEEFSLGMERLRKFVKAKRGQAD